jgi:hypothetical protein
MFAAKLTILTLKIDKNLKNLIIVFTTEKIK